MTVGLDIGGNAVRVAVLDASKSGRRVRRFAEMPLPAGAVDGGEILNEGAVTEAIAALWKHHQIPRRRVVVGTANQRSVVRQVDVPQMGSEELAEALPFHVQDSIPMAVESAVLDFIPLERFVTPDGEPMQSILTVAVHSDIIDSIMRIADDANLSLAAVDLQAFALVRSIFGLEGEESPRLQAVVDVGASVTQVVIARGGTAEFVRLLPRGGDGFSAALRDELGLDGVRAEELKRTVGVAPIGPPEIDNDEVSLVRQILTKQADSLIEELRGSLEYYASTTNADQVSKIVVAGNAARLPHLASRVSRSLGLPIEPARVLDQFEIDRVHLTDAEILDAQPVLPVAVGLGLWGEV